MTITTTQPCTRCPLEKLQNKSSKHEWRLNPALSLLLKATLQNEQFHIGIEPLPTILEKPIKSLGQWYNADLRDTQQLEQPQQDTVGLKQINNTALLGKLKLWCFQFGLLPRLVWPITMYEVWLSHANGLERLINSHVGKWLGLPRCLSSAGLYGNWAVCQSEGGHVSHIIQKEEAARCSKAVAQAGQGCWMKWESTEKWKLTWNEIRTMESNRLSFIIRSTYNVLPSPANLSIWLGGDPSCPLCTAPATLQHLLVGWKTSLAQGRYSWRHNRVLGSWTWAQEGIHQYPALKQPASAPTTSIQEGDKLKASRSPLDLGSLKAATDWLMQENRRQRLVFPSEIAVSTLRPPCDHPATRPRPLVQVLSARLYHRADSPLGECDQWV